MPTRIQLVLTTKIWLVSARWHCIKWTRGNNFKLIQHHCHYDLRKFNFTNWVIPIWSRLSNHVVSADTINTFKDRLDKFRSNQDVLYGYKAYLHGIENRSITL